MKLKNKTLGFTLIELLVAISIIVILASVGAVSYANANKSSRDSRRQTDIEQVRSALEIYRADYTGYPSATVQGNLAIISGLSPYLGGATSITDPTNNASYYYRYEPGPVGCTSNCTQYTITYYLELPAPGPNIKTAFNP